jgi:hypothetical protein
MVGQDPRARTTIKVPIWPFGQINIRREDGSVLFSERYRLVPTRVVFGWRFTRRAWR